MSYLPADKAIQDKPHHAWQPVGGAENNTSRTEARTKSGWATPMRRLELLWLSHSNFQLLPDAQIVMPPVCDEKNYTNRRNATSCFRLNHVTLCNYHTWRTICVVSVGNEDKLCGLPKRVLLIQVESLYLSTTIPLDTYMRRECQHWKYIRLAPGASVISDQSK